LGAPDLARGSVDRKGHTVKPPDDLDNIVDITVVNYKRTTLKVDAGLEQCHGVRFCGIHQ
jgi:hypothetical protein